MNNIGNAFRIARISKGMNQREVADGILSVAALSKFESGKSMVTVDKFHKLLNRLSMTYLEFEVSFMDSNEKTQAEFLSILSESLTNNNLFQLEHEINNEYLLYESTKNIRHLHNYLLGSIYKSYYSNKTINKKNVKLLYNYLVVTNEWSSYDVILFGNILPFISIKQIKLLSNEIYSRSSQLFKLPRFKVDLIKISLNICHIFIKNGEFDSTFTMLKDCESLVDSVPYINEKNRYKYIRGILLMHTSNYEEGLKIAKNAIEIYGQFGLYDRAQILSQELKGYVEKIGNYKYQ